jgi:predicted alpha/beta-hydrolase family hydrolase
VIKEIESDAKRDPGAFVSEIDVETPSGTARVHLHPAEEPVAALMLGHGAGGGVGAPDLVAATDAALSARVSVALVEQPYRVAGKRSQPVAAKIDAAWVSVAEQLLDGALAGLPLIAGGRSAGARVACRTAAETGAIAVLCLAFPLQPPPRRSGSTSPSRLDELEAVSLPVLVVQGEGDRFGIPPEGKGREVVLVRGDHGLKSDADGVGRAVAGWLDQILATVSAGRA